MPPEDFIGFARSCSYIRNVLSRTDLPRFEQDLRRLIETNFGGDWCQAPIRTEMWAATRR